MVKSNLIKALIVAGIAFCCSGAAKSAAPSQATASDWTLIGGGPLEQHFSSLAQVNDSNVGTLGLAWFTDLESADGPTGVPMVAGGVIYESGPLGKVWAHDARTGRLLWTYDAKIQFPTGLVASWGARLSRGLALWDDTVLKATGDCRLIALDRLSGKRRWEVQPCDPAAYKTITGAPRVGGGKVFIGNSNADSGVGRGYVDAYDIRSGKHLWRFYTVPGDPSKGFENAAMERASKTWGKEYWKVAGGGSPWEGITYDAVTNLVYIGTDGPAPFNPAMRGEGRGDELFTNAIVAVNADTGNYVWHYSTTPEDGWNYAATMPVVLADLTIAGTRRHVVMSAPKNGFFYVLDAATGQLVNEPRPIIPINWASGIDMKSGRPIVRDEARYWLKGKEGSIVSPSPMGAHNWMPMSYSPDTGLVYIPATDYPAKVAVDPVNSVGNVEIDFYYPLTHTLPFTGRLVAWDPVAQIARWTQDVGLPYEGGTLATAGNLVFQGTTDGHFNAYRADTGERVYSFYAGSGILGAPSTVEIDGRQIILVAAGSGTTSAVGFAQKFSGTAPGPARLLAFAIDGRIRLPPLPPGRDPIPLPPAAEPDAALAKEGKAIWDANGCELCHGFKAVGGLGSVPDLRRIPAPHYDVFSQIIRGGLFKATGMPIFADSIREDDLAALKAYLIGEAWKGYRADQAAKP
jgi:quinohemoprotein ethanol dehydrogenase